MMWWETLPMMWLLVLCSYDLHNDFSLRRFYCEMVKDLILKMRLIRPNCNNESCPIFKKILDNREKLEVYCPDKIKIPPKNNQFWGFIKRMGIRYQQASFFEVLFIQLFICCIEANLKMDTRLTIFYGAMTAIFFLFPYLLFTYFSDGTLIFYEIKIMRTLIVISLWIIIIML